MQMTKQQMDALTAEVTAFDTWDAFADARYVPTIRGRNAAERKFQQLLRFVKHPYFDGSKLVGGK